MSDATRTEAPAATSAPSPEPDTRGASLEATYHLERVIASGGMGVVLAARHKHLGTRVAVKLLHDTSPSLRQRFSREAQLAASLDSPFIVRVRDYGFAEDGQPFLVMDLLEGRTLRARIRDEGLDPAEAKRLAVELTRALVAVHDVGIVHRDIKPTNVLLTLGMDGLEHVKLIDFGIAKRQQGESETTPRDELTGSNEVLGTTAYMAPEQLVEARVVDQRADVFSLGAVMYEMLTRTRALDVEAHVRRLALATTGADSPIRPISEHVRGAPDVFVRIVTRCLSSRPEHRFASAHDLLDALLGDDAAVSASLEPAAMSATGPVTGAATAQPAKPARSGSITRWIAAATALAGALGLFVWSRGATIEGEPSAAAPASASSPTVRADPSPATSPITVATAMPVASATETASTSAAPPTAARPAWKPKPKGPRWDDRH